MNDAAKGLLAKATVVHLQPDDVLLISNIGEYGSEAAEFIKAAFPDKKVIMFAEGIDLKVLRDLEPCPYCVLPEGWDACPVHRDGQ